MTDPAGWQLLATLKDPVSPVRDVAFSPDGRRVVTSGRGARVWEASGKHLALAGDFGLSSAAFSPNDQGCRLITASPSSGAHVWDAGSGQLLATFGEGPVFHAAFSPDGLRVCTADIHTASFFDAATQKLLAAPLSVQGSWVMAAGSRPDGLRVITAKDGDDFAVQLWDGGNGQLLGTLSGHTRNASGAAFGPVPKDPSDPAPRILTTGHDRTARIWEYPTGQPLATLQGHSDTIRGARFSSSGRLAVTASLDRTARVWDAVTGALLCTLSGHQDQVLDAELSPDSRRVVTASADQTARVWDAATGALLATLAGHTQLVHRATFSPDGRCIATASHDQTARVWQQGS